MAPNSTRLASATAEEESIALHATDNAPPRISINVSVLPVINYAMHQNGAPMVQSILLENLTEEDIEDIDLQITSTPAFSITFDRHIDLLPAKKVLEISRPQVLLNGEFLSSITERIKGLLQFTLKVGNDSPISHYAETTVLAYDQWHGLGLYPEFLAAFITPNHPQIVPILNRASEFLGQWTGDTSMDGYLSQDPNRVLSQAAAVYSALKEQEIAYALPPAGFGTTGQRVRLVDKILQQKMGTCLDLTLLYAACLEALGLRPILITIPSHIFLGLWLEEKMFPECVQDDASLITKRLASGISEIAVIECTCVVSGRSHTFDGARLAAEENLRQNPVDYIIDVYRARMSQIFPLSQQGVLADYSHKTSAPTVAPTEIAPPTKLDEAIHLTTEQVKEEELPKKVQWERKLLDLGMRNSLINLRLTKNQLPLLTDSLDALENALADGSDFTILPKPADWAPEAFSFEYLHEKRSADILQAEFQNKRLRSILTETELSKAMKELYRTARTALEENGANTLYLALGMLRWYETPRSTKSRYAPIILLPIEMVRKSAAQGYVIRLRDDEPQVNVTLLEKLKQDFSVTIGGLDPLPTDDHGIDIRKVLTIVRQAIMEQPRWDVLETACMGIFSFSQFVMWNDIRYRAQDLMANKVVHSLIDGKLAWDAEPLEIGDQVSEEDILLPMAADASQLYAIEAACQGHSFVLHGPPGTGKSQTITTLIANALAKGKRVLFVAEKMAALEVVQKRLDKIGIGPFCLELHSNKSRKRDVLEQLRKASEVTKTASPEAFSLKAEQLEEMRRELDGYARQLHRPLPCGASLHTLINEYEYYKDAAEIRDFDRSFIQSLSPSSADAPELLVERLTAAGREIGHPHNHPLGRVRCSRYSQSLRGELPSTVNRYRESLELLRPHVHGFAEAIGEPIPNTFSHLQELVRLAEEMVCWYSMPLSWAKVTAPAVYFPQVIQMAEHFRKANDLESELLKTFEPPFLELDGQQLLSQCRDASGKWFLPKLLGLNKLRKVLQGYSKQPIEKDQIEGHLLALRDYGMERKTASDLLQTYGGDLEAFYKGKETDWNQILEFAIKAQSSAQKLYDLRGSYAFMQKYCGNGDIRAAVMGLHTGFSPLVDAKTAFDSLLGIVPGEAPLWFTEEVDLCHRVIEHADVLKEWIAYVSTAEEAKAKGLENVVDYYEAGAEHDSLFPAYKKAALRALIAEAIDGSDCLNGFSGAIFNEKIQQYKRMDRQWCTLSQEEIYCRLASKVPNFTKEAAQSSELGILQRCIKSGGRGTSIRKLFDQIPNLLPRLCPCMLMSPISAAQYLDPKSEPFDIVVFDEASQLPTCKAVGVLARGKNAIIVGDPKQMPPTSFFATNTVDEDNPDIEDLESILDDCLALNMPQSHLLWHYRSRHESLIAFSNSQFYENRLFTFPSVNDRESKVRLVKVDGVFDRGKTRTNRAEAEAVVAEIKRRAKDPLLSQYSVGIVTFNISQQHLIDDLMAEAYVKDPQLEKWALREDEPLFIKNLENVQGDERDVILFSIGFGPDQDGKVFMNFGPLNRDGGWRRLNVAVSRARGEMIVFTTLSADRLDLNRTKAEGVAALRKFLEYAEGKALTIEECAIEKTTKSKNGIAATICKALKEQGYHTELSIGRSKFRMDIGVIDPENPEQYLLGIMLDGASYGSAKTTRDRELAQTSVLSGLGWQILRIWSMDWWDNPRKEIKKILDTLQQLRERPGREAAIEALSPPAEATADESKAEPVAGVPEAVVLSPCRNAPASGQTAPPVYSAARLPMETIPPEIFIDPLQKPRLRQKIESILSQEAPICLQALTRRIIQSCGISRSGPRIQSHISSLLREMDVPTTLHEDTLFYWTRDRIPETYPLFRVNGEGDSRRDVREVPVEEVANAVCVVLYEQISMAKEDLLREVANKLGYTRLGSNVLTALEAGIAFAVQWNAIITDSRGAYILSETGTSRAEATLKSF